MTAAEIHALYVPLWELVPETRPQQRIPLVGKADGDVERLAWRTDTAGCSDFYWDYLREHVNTNCALALCRSAVLEWLLKDHASSVLFYHGAAGIGIQVSDGNVSVAESQQERELDRALVAAALRVARGKPDA